MSPFIKVKTGKNKGKYKSPSGRIYTAKQVKLYYVRDGFPRTEAERRQYRRAKKKK